MYPAMDVPAVDKLNLEVHRGEIFGLLGPTAPARPRRRALLTTRVVPTSGSAYISGIDVKRHPALVKQLSGIVSQQNTLDRQLTVWEEPLLPRTALWHQRERLSTKVGRTARALFALEVGEGVDLRSLGRHGPASDGGARDLPQSRRALHGRTDGRPGPAESSRALDLLTELNNAGQTVTLTTHYMEEADQLCDRVAIMDHGKILALDTPANLKKSTGADTIVTSRSPPARSNWPRA